MGAGPVGERRLDEILSTCRKGLKIILSAPGVRFETAGKGWLFPAGLENLTPACEADPEQAGGYDEAWAY